MTNLQRDKKDSCNRVDAFNTTNATLLSPIAEYAAQQTIFANALLGINTAVQLQQTAAKVKASQVEVLKLGMGKTVIKYAERAAVLADENGDTDLAKSLTKPITYISKATKTNAVARATDIRDLLNNNLKTLTNITAANITEIDDAIAAYVAKKDKPTINKQARKAAGTNPLPSLFKTAFKAIDAMYKLVDSYFSDTNQPLVDELALAKKIIRTGIHHTGVQGVVRKNGVIVPAAFINIIATTKFATTDLNGAYSIIKVRAKTYIIQAKNDAGDTDSKTVTLKRGQIITVDFDLK